MIIFLRWNARRLEEEKFKAMNGALYTNIKTNPNRPDQYCFNAAFLIRRVIYALSINELIFYFIEENSTVLLLNVFLQVIMSGALITYVAKCHPFEELRDNYIEMFNETTIFILFVIPLAALIVDESILGPNQRILLGYVLIGILLLNLGVNYLIFILHLLY